VPVMTMLEIFKVAFPVLERVVVCAKL
jgi:hypothetical protein